MVNRLLLGRALSALATALIPTTLTLAVLRVTGDGGAVGLVLASELIPLLLLLPFGGVLADRLRPGRVVLLADLTRCLTQAAMAVELLLGLTRLLDLAILSAVAGAAIAFGSPAVPRLVVAVVPGPDRLRVNARIGVATSLSAVAAPAIAGTIIVVAGPGWAAALTAVLFACSAVTLGGIRTDSAVAAPQNFWDDLGQGWREIRQRPWFLGCVLGHGVWHFVAGLFLTLAPVAAVHHLGGETSWMVIVQSGTVGLVLGVFAAPRLRVRRPLVAVQAGAACYLLPMVALAMSAPAAVLAGAYFVAMFGLGLLSPLWETVVAEEIPEGALGRVRAFDQLISFASRPFGLAVAAPLAGVTGVTALALTGGVLVAAANLAALSPHIRKATTGERVR
ncbi:Major Facilitator Superfamily protein [Nonomuraea solani]|uniref:Major Facilitator Superfamily protein n=1 Tax=Nonomuraea solani TaxID=1144553 RepID=A0A1H5U1E1_9ACTN|nr:MFS transporter [Nonomuraea solani]SEF68071.1 Major Facilitator Superfamily protein [Nonomuraea solani]